MVLIIAGQGSHLQLVRSFHLVLLKPSLEHLVLFVPLPRLLLQVCIYPFLLLHSVVEGLLKRSLLLLVLIQQSLYSTQSRQQG